MPLSRAHRASGHIDTYLSISSWASSGMMGPISDSPPRSASLMSFGTPSDSSRASSFYEHGNTARLGNDFIRAGIKHYQLIRYGLVTHSIGTNLMVKRWLADWLEDRSGSFYSRLISGLDDNKTIKTNIAIARLARLAQNDPEARNALMEISSREIGGALSTDPRLKEFDGQLRQFLKTYGHRSHTREICYPRWADDPTLVIDVVKALITSEIGDLEMMEREKIRERKETEKEVLERLTRLRYDIFKKLIFRPVLHYAQTYLMFRENQRFYLMVTSNTDPGWTAVFSKLGGLITETGGILSHGVVVSREYGIPAVTAVKGATGFFRTGQMVTPDGNDGTIYILEEA